MVKGVCISRGHAYPAVTLTHPCSRVSSPVLARPVDDGVCRPHADAVVGMEAASRRGVCAEASQEGLQRGTQVRNKRKLGACKRKFGKHRPIATLEDLKRSFAHLRLQASALDGLRRRWKHRLDTCNRPRWQSLGVIW